MRGEDRSDAPRAQRELPAMNLQFPPYALPRRAKTMAPPAASPSTTTAHGSHFTAVTGGTSRVAFRSYWPLAAAARWEMERGGDPSGTIQIRPRKSIIPSSASLPGLALLVPATLRQVVDLISGGLAWAMRPVGHWIHAARPRQGHRSLAGEQPDWAGRGLKR